MNSKERSMLIDNINTGFGYRPCFLFIGEHISTETLPKQIADMSWSGVITTSDDNKLIDAFNRIGGRKINDIMDLNTITANRRDMPFVYLNRFLNFDENATPKKKKTRIQRVLTSALNRFLSNGDYLYVIGYKGDEFDFSEITERTKSVYFFGISEDNIEEPDENYKYIEEPLESFLPDTSEEIAGESDNEDDAAYFYINGKVKSIPQYELMKTSSYICLADRNKVDRFVPYGRQMQKKYFLKFLETSSSAFPQWYAYAPNTRFNVNRSFEPGLNALVDTALRGEPMPGDRKGKINYDSSKPIVLMGPPSSSKSVVLGALAYRIYKNGEYPVLYVRDDFFRIIGSEKYGELEELMQKISSLDDSAKILLICDCSSAVNGLKEGKKIAKYLNDRGRRFVLVVSSYEHSTEEKSQDISSKTSQENSKVFYWNQEKKAFLSTITEVTDQPILENTRSFFIVRSNRKVSRKEVAEIDRLFKNHSGLTKTDGPWWKNFKEEEDDIFEYFYKLAFIVRDPLQKQLSREKEVFREELEAKLRNIYTLNYNKIGSLFPELKKLYEEDDDKRNNLQVRLENFQKCVALFSRYLIPVPRALVMKIVDNSIDTSVVYSTGGIERDLERFLTTSIPWIKYREIGGSFFFTFRNTREAGIYLKNVFGRDHDTSEAVKFILSMLDLYNSLDSCDAGIVNALASLLRSVGPNAQEKYNDNNYDVSITPRLKDVIDKMAEIRDELDPNCVMAMTMFTFRREHYGKIVNSSESEAYPKEKYESVLKSLIKTANDCQEKYKTLDSKYNRSLMEQLENERVLCLLHYETYLSKYNKKYKGCSDSQFRSLLGVANFESAFSSLERIIRDNPTNGFSYNTLFKLFEQRFPYDKVKNVKAIGSQMLTYTGRVASIVDLYNSVDVENTGANGNNELGQHISEFVSFISGATNIGIENIDTNIEFAEMFGNALELGDASYIWLICYKELLNAKEQLPVYRYGSYKKIFDFMYIGERNGRKIFDVIKKDLSALHLMLRTYWLAKTGDEPQAAYTKENECRFTHFKTDEWSVIKEITESYCNLCREKDTSGNPFLRYIFALSELYVNDLSEEAFNICKKHLPNGNARDYDYGGIKRMYTPFVLCDEKGDPLKCSATIIGLDGDKRIVLNIVLPSPYRAEIHCYARRENISPERPNNLKVGDRLTDSITIGIRYTGFQGYSIDLVNKWEERRKDNGRK